MSEENSSEIKECPFVHRSLIFVPNYREVIDPVSMVLERRQNTAGQDLMQN